MDLKTVATALGLDVAAIGIAEALRGHVVDQISKNLTANSLGFGISDEVLFASAITYAVIDLHAEVAEVNKVIKIIDSYSLPEKRRIVRIIGKSEQQVPSPVVTKKAEKALEKKDEKGGEKKEEKKEEKSSAAPTFDNVRGGRIIYLLSKMDEAAIRNFFRASGADDTFENKIRRLGAQIKKIHGEISGNKTVQSILNEVKTRATELRDDYHSTMTTETPLERLAGKIDIFGLFK